VRKHASYVRGLPFKVYVVWTATNVWRNGVLESNVVTQTTLPVYMLDTGGAGFFVNLQAP
jgi:hypothetical protein